MSSTKIEIENDRRERQNYDFSTFKVLVVDDFPFIADLIGSTLAEMGVGKVMKVENGQIAKERIGSFNLVQSINNIDVVILDWLMPVMNGAELLKWIREHKSETIRFMPVIVCSAYTSTKFVEKARDMGATEVMVKPVSAEKLASRIQHAIEKPRPFIKTEEYFGPDRRRKDEKIKHEDRRKTTSEEMEVHDEQF